MITYTGWDAAANQAEVAAYVDGVDTGGVCTLTLTSGGRTATTSRPAIQDAKNVQCGTLSIARTALAPGSWTAVVSYQSPDRSGRSDSATVEVPQ